VNLQGDFQQLRRVIIEIQVNLNCLRERDCNLIDSPVSCLAFNNGFINQEKTEGESTMVTERKS
jgi:hypothetical protein